MIDQMIANFGRIKNDLVIDYEHDSVSDRNGPHPAAGWIKALEKRKGEDGLAQLWAQVEWTDQAAEMIRAGQYKYCSPVIDLDATDRASGDGIGTELFNCAITNNPFLDGQRAIELSRRRATARVTMADATEDKKPKADETTAPEEQKKPASVTAAEDGATDYAAAFDLLGEAAGMDRDQAMAALMSNMDAIVSVLKGSDSGAAEMARDAVNAATAVLTAQIETLKSEVVTLRRDAHERSERELSAKIDRLVADKCLLPKNRESARVALRNDPNFENILRGATAVVPTLQGEDDGEDNAEEREVRSLSKGQQKKYQSLRRLSKTHAEAIATAKRWVKDDAASAA